MFVFVRIIEQCSPSSVIFHSITLIDLLSQLICIYESRKNVKFGMNPKKSIFIIPFFAKNKWIFVY